MPEQTASEPPSRASMRRCRAALRAHRDRLMSLPNVVGVGIGYKAVAGRTSNRPAIVVLVSKKVDAQALAPGAAVPPEVDGVPTDVVEIGEPKAMLANGTHLGARR